MDAALTNFLKVNHKEAMEFAERTDGKLTLMPVGGDPPNRYVAVFAAQGLVQEDDGTIRRFEQAAFGIQFPEDYLKSDKPVQIAAFLGPHKNPWHPNLRFNFCCLAVWPRTSLIDVILALYDIWTWRFWETTDRDYDGLNHDAAQYARREGGPGPLLRKEDWVPLIKDDKAPEQKPARCVQWKTTR